MGLKDKLPGKRLKSKKHTAKKILSLNQFGSKNLDLLQSQSYEDSFRYRDVHEAQQLKRGKKGLTQTYTSRRIFTIVLSVVIFISLFFFGALVRFGLYQFSEFRNPDKSVVVNYNPDMDPYLNPELKKKAKMDEKFNYPYTESAKINGVMLYRAINKTEAGVVIENTEKTPVYKDIDKVPVPKWYAKKRAGYLSLQKKIGKDKAYEKTMERYKSQNMSYFAFKFDIVTLGILLLDALITLGVYGFLDAKMKRNYEAQTALERDDDINQHENDGHIALPEEILLHEDFDMVPDAGMHFSCKPNSIISHFMLNNKGLKSVKLTSRHEEDELDSDGDVVAYKGEPIVDKEGYIVQKKVPLVDEDFGYDLFKESGQPEGLMQFYDSSKIIYNQDCFSRSRLKGYNKLSDAINGDWELPYYEVQRPGGFYLVDTAPVNSMLIAMTRAGKGQTYIEAYIDILSRMKDPDNILSNDPKGELLLKFLVPLTYRGFDVVQFNLMNVLKTSVYNPLFMALTSAREGDKTKTSMYIENIADVFFPIQGADDPLWPSAANNAFKRTAYALIDFYLEEEAEIRRKAIKTKMSNKVLETKLDNLWGKVTLYNCYRFFVQLTSRKLPAPSKAYKNYLAGSGDIPSYFEFFLGKELFERCSGSKHENLSSDDKELLNDLVSKSNDLWENKPEIDLLTLYFNATKLLPQNQIRNLVDDADSSLRSIGGAEKMLSSCELLRLVKKSLVRIKGYSYNLLFDGWNERVTPLNTYTKTVMCY